MNNSFNSKLNKPKYKIIGGRPTFKYRGKVYGFMSHCSDKQRRIVCRDIMINGKIFIHD